MTVQAGCTSHGSPGKQNERPQLGLAANKLSSLISILVHTPRNVWTTATGMSKPQLREDKRVNPYQTYQKVAPAHLHSPLPRASTEPSHAHTLPAGCCSVPVAVVGRLLLCVRRAALATVPHRPAALGAQCLRPHYLYHLHEGILVWVGIGLPDCQ
jgi:hypothetical protein